MICFPFQISAESESKKEFASQAQCLKITLKVLKKQVLLIEKKITFFSNKWYTHGLFVNKHIRNLFKIESHNLSFGVDEPALIQYKY